MLAKLAAVRLRAAQEPEEVAAAVPQPPREELNVWTERPVRTTGHPADAAQAGRVPGQASPWFKPPRPLADEPAGAPAPVAAAGQPPAPRPQSQGPAAPQQSEQVVEPQHRQQPQAAPQQAQPARSEQPVPAEEPAQAEPSELRPAPSRLDPDLAYEALVTYMDNHGHQPDPQRLADWLTREYGVTGKAADGSVHPKEVAELFPELRDRYAAAGRD
jgi:hypothetical protein